MKAIWHSICIWMSRKEISLPWMLNIYVAQWIAIHLFWFTYYKHVVTCDMYSEFSRFFWNFPRAGQKVPPSLSVATPGHRTTTPGTRMHVPHVSEPLPRCHHTVPHSPDAWEGQSRELHRLTWNFTSMEKTCAVCGYKLVCFTNLSVRLPISVWFPHPEARRRPDLNIYSHLAILGSPATFLPKA
jgi:hypothetical protein